MYDSYDPAPPGYDTGDYLSPQELAAAHDLHQLRQQGYELTPELVGEVGRRRGLRRFGRAFGAILTGGASEMARAGIRRRANRLARMRQPEPVAPQIPLPTIPAQVLAPPQTINFAGAQQVANAAAHQAVAKAMEPRFHTSGLFGLSDASVPPGGTGELSARSEFTTVIERFIFVAYSPDGVITPADAESYIRIMAIHIAGQSVFSTNQGAPLRVFAGDSTGVQMRTRTLNGGQSISIIVANRHRALTLEVGGSGIGPQETT